MSLSLPAEAASARPIAWPRIALRAAWVLLCVGVVLPVVRARVLPLVDLPQHASQVALWIAHGSDPAIQRWYDVHLGSPYVAFYVLWRACMLVGLSLDDAGRMAVGLVLLGIPCAFAWLLHVRRRPVEWSLFAFPVVYSHSLAFGFLPFALTLPLFLLSLALCSAWVERGGWWRALLVTGSGLLVVWSHGLTAALWCAACGLVAVLPRGTLRERVVRLVPLVPVVVLFLWLLHARGGGHMQLAEGIPGRVREFGFFLHGALTPEVHARARWVTRLVVVAALLGGVGARRRILQAIDVPLFAAGLAALALYLLLPFEVYGAYFIYCRFAPFAFLLLVGALAPVPWRRVRASLSVLLIAVSAATLWQVQTEFAAFSAQVGDVRPLFDRLPHGASVFRPDGAQTTLAPFALPVFEHLATSAQASTLGPAATFAGNAHMLVRESKTPPPRFDALLETGEGGALSVRVRHDRLPDALVFFTPQPPPDTIAAEGAPYRLLGRTGGTNVFVREGPAK